MSPAIKKNFRGKVALVVQREMAGREILQRTLANLGLRVRIADPSDGHAIAPSDADLVFFDTDDGAETFPDGEWPAEIPLIALVGSEAPSRLSRAVRLRVTSHIQKPVRSSGIFTALFLAMNEQDRRNREAAERAALERRAGARQVVFRAVLTRMSRRGIDDREAYVQLRREAMRRRMTLEDVARSVVDAEAEPAARIPASGSQNGAGSPMAGLAGDRSTRGDQE